MRMMLSALVLISAVSAPAATAATPRVLKNVARAAKAAAIKTKVHAKAPLCANLAGHWQGTCLDEDGETEESTVTIEQEGCETFTVDGNHLGVDGLTSMQFSPSAAGGDSGASSITWSLAWNDAQSRLNMMATMSLGFSGETYAGVYTNQTWLVGDQLRVKDGTGTPLLNINGGSPLTLVHQDCTYSRVQ